MDWGPVMRESLGRTVNDVLAATLEFAKAGQREGVFNPDADLTHVVVSMIGIHFMPFALGEIVERFTGTSPFHASFVEERKRGRARAGSRPHARASARRSRRSASSVEGAVAAFALGEGRSRRPRPRPSQSDAMPRRNSFASASSSGRSSEA